MRLMLIVSVVAPRSISTVPFLFTLVMVKGPRVSLAILGWLRRSSASKVMRI